MKLYEKKFPIYKNSMISIFGQPGLPAMLKLASSRKCYLKNIFIIVMMLVLGFEDAVSGFAHPFALNCFKKKFHCFEKILSTLKIFYRFDF